MEIEEETFIWCASCGLDLKIDFKDQGFVRLTSESSDRFVNGLYIAEILQDKFDIELHGVLDDSLAAIKLANWNLLGPAIAKIGIKIPHPTKTLIIAGDYKKISELLEQLHVADIQ